MNSSTGCIWVDDSLIPSADYNFVFVFSTLKSQLKSLSSPPLHPHLHGLVNTVFIQMDENVYADMTEQLEHSTSVRVNLWMSEMETTLKR